MFIIATLDFLGQNASATTTAGQIGDALLAGGGVAVAVALVLACVMAWLVNLIAMPGNWIAVALMALYAWLGPESGRMSIGVASLATVFGLGLVGEAIEFAAGAVGAQRAGASRRATIYAVAGSMAGAVTGAVVGIPIPVIGPVIAALLFAGLGATAGAMWAEWTDGRPWRENWRIGQAAFWGRTAGTAGKMIAGLAIVVTCLIAVIA